MLTSAKRNVDDAFGAVRHPGANVRVKREPARTPYKTSKLNQTKVEPPQFLTPDKGGSKGWNGLGVPSMEPLSTPDNSDRATPNAAKMKRKATRKTVQTVQQHLLPRIRPPQRLNKSLPHKGNRGRVAHINQGDHPQLRRDKI